MLEYDVFIKLITQTTTDIGIIAVLILLLLFICPVTTGNIEMEQTIRLVANKDFDPINNGETEGVVDDIVRELEAVVG